MTMENIYNSLGGRKAIFDKDCRKLIETTGRNVQHSAHVKTILLKATPSKLNFTFSASELDIKRKTVVITNYSSNVCPLEILPLETEYFKIMTRSRRRLLNPGAMFKVNIAFHPDEARGYNDIFKIRYSSRRELLIHISARLDTHFSFPIEIDFGNVPLGTAVYYKIPIYSCKERKFSFAVLPRKESPCIDIYPRWGFSIPGERPTIITIIYRPLRYISIHFQIHIFISGIYKTPFIVNFYAYTRPGSLRETLRVSDQNFKIDTKPKGLRFIPRREIETKPVIAGKAVSPEIERNQTFTDYRIYESLLSKLFGHMNLLSLHGINCILNSRIKKWHEEREAKGPLNIYMTKIIMQKQQKRKEFLMKAEECRRENNKAMINHGPKVDFGYVENLFTIIILEREQTRNDYNDLLITTFAEDLIARNEARKIRQRILRNSFQCPECALVPDNGGSFLHSRFIQIFVNLARKVISRNRLFKVLWKLKTLNPEVLCVFE